MLADRVGRREKESRGGGGRGGESGARASLFFSFRFRLDLPLQRARTRLRRTRGYARVQVSSGEDTSGVAPRRVEGADKGRGTSSARLVGYSVGLGRIVDSLRTIGTYRPLCVFFSLFLFLFFSLSLLFARYTRSGGTPTEIDVHSIDVRCLFDRFDVSSIDVRCLFDLRFDVSSIDVRCFFAN